MKYYFIYLLSFLMIVSGCSSEAHDTNEGSTEEASYVVFVNIEGQNYTGHEAAEKGQYTIAEEVGGDKGKI